MNGQTATKPPIKYTWKKKAKSELERRFTCTRSGILAWLCSFWPIIEWTRQYSWRRDLISDLVAGITVGIMSIPQGMSYAGVAGVPAVYGLYSNIFPTIMYFFLGTSKLAAIGPPAVVSIMLGNARHRFIPDSSTDYSIDCYPDVANLSIADIDHRSPPDPIYGLSNPACFTSWEILTAMTLLIGVFLVVMGVFGLGYFSKYLSECLVGGFTSGAAIHAMTSQMGYVFGVNLPWYSGPGKIILTYVALFRLLPEAVLATAIVSIISITSLLITKLYFNTKFQKAFGVPIPAELFLVLIGTAASHLGHFEDRYQVAVVHRISAGFPTPMAPRFDLMQRVALDALITSIVLYSLSISLAKLYAKRNDYKIDANQEFFAFGLINLFGSFFHCIASGQIVSRSIVYESAGAKSQFAGAFGSVLVVVTILWVAPLLASLPKCILGSIIVVACIQMLKQLKQLRVLWKNSKLDFVIYLFTFLSVVLLDVKEGLLSSVIFAGLITLIRNQCVKRRKDDGSTGGEEPSRSLEIRPKNRVFRLDEPLYFANTDRFKRQLYELCGLSIDDMKEDARMDGEMAYYRLSEPIALISTPTGPEDSTIGQHYAVIDCSGFDYIDSMGVRALRQVDQDLERRGITLYYVNCSGDNFKKLLTTEFLDDARKMRTFPSVEIALAAASFKSKSTFYGTSAISLNQETELIN